MLVDILLIFLDGNLDKLAIIPIRLTHSAGDCAKLLGMSGKPLFEIKSHIQLAIVSGYLTQ